MYFKYLWDVRMEISSDKLEILLTLGRGHSVIQINKTDIYWASTLFRA